MEETLSIIKPDAMERNLEDKIKNIFIKNNFEIIKEKKVKLEKKEAEQFYKVHQAKPFYNDLCDYLSSGPVLVMVLKKITQLQIIEKSWERPIHRMQIQEQLGKNLEFQLIKILYMGLIVKKMQIRK